MKKLLIATRNKGKLREIVKILNDLPYEFISLEDIGFGEEIEENGKSFIENATLKAKQIGEQTNLLTLAEDSGLEVDQLDGRPGIYSARYKEGSDADRIEKVLDELKDVPKERRTARFRSVVAIYNPATKQVFTFIGESEGLITDKPIGENGFGYDPIFYNFDLGKTNGEVTLEEKNKVSHRGRVLAEAKIFLQKLL